MRKKKSKNVSLMMLIVFLAHIVYAGLDSDTYQIEQAKQVINDIYRETRLNDGDDYWGDQYRDDIASYSKLYGANYFSIFRNMEINDVIARCAVNAMHSSDSRRWIEYINLFDQAAEELGKKDRARYYFAKGLVLLKTIPSEIRGIPEPFLKAAENGYPSAALGSHVSKAVDLQSDFAGDVLIRIAESYSRGEFFLEAFKFYALALKYGQCDADIFIRMSECAANSNTPRLALTSAFLLIEYLRPWDGGKECVKKPNRNLPVSPASEPNRLSVTFEPDSLERMFHFSTQDKYEKTVKERNIERFNDRYIRRIADNTGIYSDRFYLTLTNMYWENKNLVKDYLLEIHGPVDCCDGTVMTLVEKISKDPVLSKDREIAKWELRRWKKAGKENEFKQSYPERFRLAQ